MFEVVKSIWAFPTTQQPGGLLGEPAPSDNWFRGKRSLLSLGYMKQARPSCLRLFTHLICCAFTLALLSAGNSIEARIAMLAITTSSSIKVKACLVLVANPRHSAARLI